MQSALHDDPVLAQVWSVLEAVPDPEIPVVSIRELGILRDVRHGDTGLEVVITPTYSGCPAMEQIADDILNALQAHGLSARIVTQLAPAWSTDWMTEEACDKLRKYGIAPPQQRCGQAQPTTSDNVLHFVRQAVPESVPCPQCGSTNTVETSRFGSTACKSMHKCLDCLEPFDYFKPY